MSRTEPTPFAGAQCSEGPDRRSRRCTRPISSGERAQRRGGWTMPILECRAISKHFGAIHALDDVCLTVSAGEVVGLMGDNGAGKSTLVKIVAGNFPPTAGKLFVGGRPTAFARPSEARECGIEVVY